MLPFVPSARGTTGHERSGFAFGELDDVVRSLPMGVIRWEPVLDDEGHLVDMVILYGNPQGAASLERPGQDVVGTRWRVDYPELDRPEFWAVVTAAWETGREQKFDFYGRAHSPPHWRTLSLNRVADHLIGIDSDVHEARVAQQQAAAAENLLRTALDASRDGFAIYQTEREADSAIIGFRMIFINATGSVVLGTERSQVHGRFLHEFYPKADDIGLPTALADAANGDVVASYGGDLEIHGDLLSFEGVCVALGDDMVLSTWRDITDRRRAERDLQSLFDDAAAVRATLETALNATTDSFAIYGIERDETGGLKTLRLVTINLAGASPFGAIPDDLVGMTLPEFFPDVYVSGLWDVIVEAISTDSVKKTRVDDYASDGTWKASYDNTVAPSGDDRLVITWRDVSDIVRDAANLQSARNEAQHHATHDVLTGLPNRALFHQKLEEALANQQDDHRTGLVFIDLDHFKNVNDTWGHAAGDRLLQVVARRLSGLVRIGDTVARLGGDEFVLVLQNLPLSWSPEELFARVCASLDEPVGLEGAVRDSDLAAGPQVASVSISASLGLVVSPPSPPDAETMIREADRAMYESKHAGRGRGTVAADRSQGRREGDTN